MRFEHIQSSNIQWNVHHVLVLWTHGFVSEWQVLYIIIHYEIPVYPTLLPAISKHRLNDDHLKVSSWRSSHWAHISGSPTHPGRKRIPGYPRIPGSSQSSHFWWWKRRNHTITTGFRGDVVKIFPAKHRFHRFLFSKLRSFSNHMLPVKSPVDRLHIMSEQYVICFK